MKFSITGVIAPKARKRYRKISLEAIKKLNFETSRLPQESGQIEISYCPIILPLSERNLYPARSYFDKKLKVFFCNPYLDYLKFVTLSEDEAKSIFYSGIGDAIPYLAKLNLSDEPIKKLEQIIERESVSAG